MNTTSLLEISDSFKYFISTSDPELTDSVTNTVMSASAFRQVEVFLADGNPGPGHGLRKT